MTERNERADLLARHLQGFTLDQLVESPESMSATEHWFVASLWAGAGEAKEKVLNHLNLACQKGFRLGWRFNYQYHPALWILKQ